MVNQATNKAQGVFVVLNDKGLHTRPATEFVKCATRFKSSVSLKYHNVDVNGKSLLGILMLAAAKGSKISVTAEGPDAEEALQALLKLAATRFNIDY